MTKDLQEQLGSCIVTDSIDELCDSINKIGPYVSNMAIGNPMSVNQLKLYSDVKFRRTSYRRFHIPKKSGGVRTITAPKGKLKDIMSSLRFIFNELYIPSPEAMAFIPNRSITNNASKHLGNNYVLNIDLKDFFTSITADMIEKSLVKFGIAPTVARFLSEICSYPMVNELNPRIIRNILPQGAPTSPVLSNMCALKLDHCLSGLSRRFHLTYTRYADDITFSSNHNVYHANGEFMKELFQIIRSCRFTVNHQKIRLQKRGRKQEVTGLTVNEKTNVSRKWTKNLRAQIHQIKYLEEPSMYTINVIRGKLNYLRMVKGADDSTYKSYIKKLNRAVCGKHIEMDDEVMIVY